MSKRKFRTPYWGAWKEIIRRYNAKNGEGAHDITEKEKDAVRAAVEATRALPDGEDRITMVDMVFWTRSHTISGAASVLYISESTAKRWHWEFVNLVGKNWWESITGILKN